MIVMQKLASRFCVTAWMTSLKEKPGGSLGSGGGGLLTSSRDTAFEVVDWLRAVG